MASFREVSDVETWRSASEQTDLLYSSIILLSILFRIGKFPAKLLTFFNFYCKVIRFANRHAILPAYHGQHQKEW